MKTQNINHDNQRPIRQKKGQTKPVRQKVYQYHWVHFLLAIYYLSLDISLHEANIPSETPLEKIIFFPVKADKDSTEVKYEIRERDNLPRKRKYNIQL